MYLPQIIVAFLASGSSQALAQVFIPPAGLFCCPPIGPNGLPLDRQQLNPYTIFCYYDAGTDQACFYNPGTGVGGGPTEGCPPQADDNPHPPTCFI